MKKRILSMLIAVAMMFSVVGVLTVSAEYDYVDDFTAKPCGKCEECLEVKAEPILISNNDRYVTFSSKVTNEILAELFESGKINLKAKSFCVKGHVCALPIPGADSDYRVIFSSLTDITPLSKMTNLETAILNGTMVTDLMPLSKLTNLTEINFMHGPVTDLTPLHGLKNLKTLYVTYTPVSLKQIKALRAALPELRMFYNANLDNNNLLGMLGISDVLEIFQYLVGLPSVFDNPSPDIFLIFVLETNEPTIFDAVDILEALVGL